MLGMTLRKGEWIDVVHPTGLITITLERLKAGRVELRVKRGGEQPRFREIGRGDQALVAISPRVVLTLKETEHTRASFAYDARADIPIRRSTANKRCA